MEIEQKCCFCVPIEFGMLALAVLTGMRAIGSLAIPYLYEEFTVVMILPFIICYGLMLIMWIRVLCYEDELKRRHKVMISWIVFVVLAANIYFLIIILNGSLLDAVCSEE